ncbi:hypothetical protein OESDEN_15368 [Oesophagostomum dentatum]|uniref:Myeloid leukemia factor n=1 Tax=Oesophagostomum dentatum TaxID=61180 RepID=A0A0B1SN05_OESDE|nr:hypothetical protein OESDEN_15368 [Oesophagostomum dentatum]
MFDDDDLFGFGGMHRAMQSQFREMDRMMNAMMDPFGMMMGPMGHMGMIEGPYGRQPPPHRSLARPFDPFGGIGGIFSAMYQFIDLFLIAMQSQFREMDRMMNAMMDPFGMMMGPMGHMGMIEGPYGRQPPPHRSLARPFDPFGGIGGIFSAMEDLQERAMNDPHSQVYTQSTMVTFGEDGQPRVVQDSVRKSGDVKETRRALRDGAREEMSIGHTIGDRTHIIEKKRDKDGNVRRQQRFVNLDEGEFNSVRYSAFRHYFFDQYYINA